MNSNIHPIMRAALAPFAPATCPPCTGACNQGGSCPDRAKVYDILAARQRRYEVTVAEKNGFGCRTTFYVDATDTCEAIEQAMNHVFNTEDDKPLPDYEVLITAKPVRKST